MFNMSLEAEMMLERLKEKHLQEMEELQAQLESKVTLKYLAALPQNFLKQSVFHCAMFTLSETDWV